MRDRCCPRRRGWSARTPRRRPDNRLLAGVARGQAGQERAAEAILRDWDGFVAFYDYPRDHWRHLRTSNAIESVFSGVRLRTRVAKGMQRRENALYLVAKVVERPAQDWRALSGGRTLLTPVLTGEVFKDGVLQREEAARTQSSLEGLFYNS